MQLKKQDNQHLYSEQVKRCGYGEPIHAYYVSKTMKTTVIFESKNLKTDGGTFDMT